MIPAEKVYYSDGEHLLYWDKNSPKLNTVENKACNGLCHGEHCLKKGLPCGFEACGNAANPPGRPAGRALPEKLGKTYVGYLFK